MACSQSYQGPVTDHFDGKHFHPVEPLANKSFFTVLKWRLTADRKVWPKFVAMDHPDNPPATVEGSDLRVTFVNHATVLLQTRGLNILTDPIWSQRASPFSFVGPKRVQDPGIRWNDLPKIDVVLISHSHYDHLDIPTVKRLAARDNPLFIVGLGVDKIIHKHVPAARVAAHDWHETEMINSDLQITLAPVQHWSARSPFDRNESLWSGFVVTTPDGKIFFAGDTGYGSGKVFRDLYARYGEMRFALIPIGAYEPRWFMKDSHMNPDEAVSVFKDVHAQHAMGIHYGTFQLTDEAIDQPVKDLGVALERVSIPTDQFRALKPGESWTLK